MNIACEDISHKALNEKIREAKDNKIILNNVIGQRYIACGALGKEIIIEGIPGNALGAYLNGTRITVKGNAQDATGDTMNDGKIVVEGSSGDATGYGMRGGEIYIKGNVGYRAGIHMKAYQEKQPVMVVGGKAGSFLGEYQAGGTIIVLGIDYEDSLPVGNFCGTGMHGGEIVIRTTHKIDIPAELTVKKAEKRDITAIQGYIKNFCDELDYDYDKIIENEYIVIRPNSNNPYKQLYTKK